jgi:hypothetical protein
MGCQSTVVLGANLTFSITTHDPDTGVLTDADGAPAYRIYEDETATAILTGSMAKLDDGNTTGFYTELIACTSANGFEVNKSYTVYIAATVDSDTGAISYSFTVEAAGSGAGAITFTYTLTSTVDSSAIVDADVWVTSDEAGNNLLGSGTTDSNGQVVFYLDAGTVYVWRQKPGWNFTNPDTETVA